MRIIALILLLFALPLGADEWLTTGTGGFEQGQLEGLEVTDDGILRLTSFEGINFALGVNVQADGNPLRRITDGNLTTEWNFEADPQVVGKTIDIDLGGNRLVDQIRILPGGDVGARRPDFFVKGYRIDIAPEEAPDALVPVAQNFLNSAQLIDTTADSTWLRYEDGEPVPMLGRHVRITITRQDLPNWVVIGDLEVFGTGFQASGEYFSPIQDLGGQMNVGAGFFQAEAPPGTQLRLQFRAAGNVPDLPFWSELPLYDPSEGEMGVYFPLQDPARVAQYRILLETDNPFITPMVESVRVEFDPRRLATSTQGHVFPVKAQMGQEVRLTYTVQVVRNPDTGYGIDLLALNRPARLDELRVDGMVIPPDGYEIIQAGPQSVQSPHLAVRLASQHRITDRADIELDFTTVFLKGSEEVIMFLGSFEEGSDPDNLQRVESRTGHQTSLVKVTDFLSSLVPRNSVELRPRVFKPDRRRGTKIEFDLTRIQIPVPVTVTIYDLSGRRICAVAEDEMVVAGRISIPWDGFDNHGDPLVPGIYLCKIQVHAEDKVTMLRTLGIAY